MKHISDKALEDFKKQFTHLGISVAPMLEAYHNWMFNEMVYCPSCNGTVERTRRDHEGNLNLTCPTCYREGKVPRYKLYEEEVVM